MFIEARRVRQIPGEPRRRWFTADGVELILWIEEDEAIVGFQLCVESDGESHVHTWDVQFGLIHSGMDDGDIRFGKHKRSPILVPNGHFDKDRTMAVFDSHSEGLPDDIAVFVRTTLDRPQEPQQ